MDIENTIRTRLQSMGEDYDSLKPFMRKWLIKVETEIQRRYNQQQTAVDALKTADYSVKSIAAEIGAARTTMYNHEQLLKRYIETSAGNIAASNPFAEISKLQAEKQLLQAQINKMMERDVDIELLKGQNKDLSVTLEGKNAEIARLQERLSTLSAENAALKASGGTSHKPTIKAFKKN